MTVLSTHFTILDRFNSRTMSLIYITKSRGHDMDPCGTPEHNGFDSDKHLLRIICTLQLKR